MNIEGSRLLSVLFSSSIRRLLRNRHVRNGMLAVTTVAGLSGCAMQQEGGQINAGTTMACPSGLHFEIQDRLFMGAGSSKGWVSPESFEKFLDRIVTPRFPRGFTVGRSAGQWRHPDGKISKEPSWILTIIHGPTPELDREVEQVADAYKYGFKQESVLRVRSLTCVSFVENLAMDSSANTPPPLGNTTPAQAEAAAKADAEAVKQAPNALASKASTGKTEPVKQK